MLGAMKSSARLWFMAAAATIMVAAGFSLAATPAQANGCITNTPGVSDGTAAHPFLIENVENLECMRDNAQYLVAGLFFKQTADIDLSAQPIWNTTIGDLNLGAFAGNYDGNGKKITGLQVALTLRFAALFGTTNGATISNLAVLNATTSLQDGHAAVLVGQATGTVITNVQTSGTVTGNVAGGIVADALDGTSISSSFSSAAAIGNIQCDGESCVSCGTGGGGLVGCAESLTALANSITDSYSSGPVRSDQAAGGLVGANVGNLTITNSYSRSRLIGEQRESGPIARFGGILGGYEGGDLAITSAFWNPTDADHAVTNNFGTEATQAAMKTAALYTAGGWDIAETTPTTKKWISCSTQNDGYPFLQWYAAQQGWTCTAPTPPGPVPPGPTPPGPPNAFVTRITGTSSTSVSSFITVPGAGSTSQAGTFNSSSSGRSAKLTTACRGTKKVTKAGRYRLSCQLTSAARSARRKGSIRVSLKTTFTPTGGAARSVTRNVTLKKTSSGVTG